MYEYFSRLTIINLLLYSNSFDKLLITDNGLEESYEWEMTNYPNS